MLRLLTSLTLLMFVASSATAVSLLELRGLIDDKQFDRAIITGEQLLEKSPTDRDALFLTAFAMQMTQQSQKASTLYRQLISLYPQLPEPRNNLAIILLEQEKYQEAASLLVEALNTHPSYATSYRNLNEIYKGIASQAYQRAVSEQKDSARLNGTIQLDTIAQIEQVSPPTQLAALNPPAANSANQAVDEAPVAVEPAVVDEPLVEEPTIEEDVSEVSVLEAPVTEDTGLEQTVTAIEVIESAATGVEETTATTTAEIGSAAVTSATEVVETVAMLNPAVEAIETPEKPRSIDEILEERIIDWANAWSSKAFDDYISFYNSDYSPKFETHGAWVEHRRQRIMRPGDIIVDVSKIQIRARSDSRAVIDFEQRYESSNYSDRVVKRIVMGRFDKQWKITAERVLSVL